MLYQVFPIHILYALNIDSNVTVSIKSSQVRIIKLSVDQRDVTITSQSERWTKSMVWFLKYCEHITFYDLELSLNFTNHKNYLCETVHGNEYILHVALTENCTYLTKITCSFIKNNQTYMHIHNNKYNHKWENFTSRSHKVNLRLHPGILFQNSSCKYTKSQHKLQLAYQRSKPVGFYVTKETLLQLRTNK